MVEAYQVHVQVRGDASLVPPRPLNHPSPAMRDQPAPDADGQRERTRKRESPDLTGGVPDTTVGAGGRAAARHPRADRSPRDPRRRADGHEAGRFLPYICRGSGALPGAARSPCPAASRDGTAHAAGCRRPPSSGARTSLPKLPPCCGVATYGSSPSPDPAAPARPVSRCAWRRTLPPRFADGVAFVPLASVHQSDLVVPTIAQVLGVRETEDQPPQERLRGFLRDRELSSSSTIWSRFPGPRRRWATSWPRVPA